MNLALSWKLSVAVVAIVVALALAAVPGSGPGTARADVDSVDPEVMVASDGTTLDVDIEGNENATDALSVAASGTSTLDNGACSDEDGGDCGAESGPGNPVTWGTVDGPYTATALLTVDCSAPEAITVTATHNGDSTPVATVYCVPNLSDEDVQIEKQADDDDSYTFDWDADNGSCLVIADDGTIDFGGGGIFDLEDNQDAEFFCENSVDLSIDEIDDHDFVAIDDCDDDDGVVIVGSRADFDIDDLDATAFCTWINDDDFNVTPTPVTGAPATITIALTATTVQCGSGTLIQVTPRSSSGGAVAAGTTITMSSSLGGTFQPASSITSSFPVTLANFLYTAPDNVSGNTTITARAGSVQTTAVIQITCSQAPAPAPTSTPAPLAPPSAGSGGLLDSSSGSGYLPYTLAAAAVAALAVATLATRRFAFGAVDAETSGPRTSARDSTPGGFALLVSLVLVAVALLVRRR